MAEYRDPKVTTAKSTGSGGAGKWIAILLALLLLALLAWWLWPRDTVEQPAAVVPAAPTTTQPAAPGAPAPAN